MPAEIGSDDNRPDASGARMWWPAALAAVTVIAVAVGAVLVFGWVRDGEGDPPALRIGGPAGSADSSGWVAAGDPGMPAAYAGTLELQADLPAGPDEAPVHRLLEPADEDFVVELAALLGLGGELRATDAEWTVSDGGAALRVARSDGQPWTFVRAEGQSCLSVPEDPTERTSMDATVGCAVSSDQAPPVDESRARAVAEPLLEVLGLNPANAQVVSGGPTTDVIAPPLVDGMRTVGLDTRLSVDESGLAWASGWLGGARAADVYLLVSAHEAFDALSDRSVGAPEIACIQAPCEAASTVVVDVVLGLSLQVDGAEPVLVPTWLFFPEGPGGAIRPLSSLAIDPSYLDPPAGGTGGGSTEPGFPGGGEPGTVDVPPAPPTDDPGSGSASGALLPAEAISAPPAGRQVQVTVSAPAAQGPCPTRLSAQVEEFPDSIVVTVSSVTEGPPPGASVRCTLEQRTVVAELAAPVGDREVIDGARGL